MNTDDRTRVARALAEVVRESLIEGEEVTVPGWGTFRVKHRPGRTENSDGKSIVHPPQDTVIFE